MTPGSVEHLVIAGAGFSHNVGLPLATGFTRKLLDVRPLKSDGPSAILVEAIRSFVDHVFGGGINLSSDQWPQLEDLFTTIDLAANTGHNLGTEYSASDLRTVRRALIVRLIRMLSIAFRKRRKAPDEPYSRVVELLENIQTASVGFLSMNWDTVIEELIIEKQGAHLVDYGCGAIAAEFVKGSVRLRRGRPPANSVTVLKPHGSVNWMYCDACSRLFWFPPSSAEQIANRLFRESDGIVVERLIDRRPKPPIRAAVCPGCNADALGTRFATFSYRKALEFPMHQATWSRTEELLREAKTWVFIGYSMPAADYEFKHLLKRVQLSRRSKPKLLLITKAPPDTTIKNSTIENFRRFFGPNALPKHNILDGGVDRATIGRLRQLGVIQ